MASSKKKLSATEDSFNRLIQQANDEINDQRIKLQDKIHLLNSLIQKNKEDENITPLLTRAVSEVLKLNENNITSRIRLAKLTSDHIYKIGKMSPQDEVVEGEIDKSKIREMLNEIDLDEE